MEILDATANDEAMVSCGSHALYTGKKKITQLLICILYSYELKGMNKMNRFELICIDMFQTLVNVDYIIKCQHLTSDQFELDTLFNKVSSISFEGK